LGEGRFLPIRGFNAVDGMIADALQENALLLQLLRIGRYPRRALDLRVLVSDISG
jgi:hypothetical protein